MKLIGLTYDLKSDYLKKGFSEEEVAEFDTEETINSLAETIKSLGYDVVKIGNIYSLTKRLAEGEKWDLVFNIAEGYYGRSRESQVPALLDAYRIPYTFSDPITLGLCLDKALTKRILRDNNILNPKFFVISCEEELETSFLEEKIEKDISSQKYFPLFVKPTTEGTGKGISEKSVVYNIESLKEQCRFLLKEYNQPILVEEYLPGREFTVGIIGTGKKAKAVGVLEINFSKNAEKGGYSFINKKYYLEKVTYSLVLEEEIKREATDIALKSYNALNCKDAGRIDLRMDCKGRINCIEINPLAGIDPIHSDLPILCYKVGITYKELISEIIKSALERIKRQYESCSSI